MKALEILAAALVVFGGLNWGLYGLLDINIIFSVFGHGLLAKVAYGIVGAAAVHQAIGMKDIAQRWKVATAAG